MGTIETIKYHIPVPPLYCKRLSRDLAKLHVWASLAQSCNTLSQWVPVLWTVLLSKRLPKCLHLQRRPRELQALAGALWTQVTAACWRWEVALWRVSKALCPLLRVQQVGSSIHTSTAHGSILEAFSCVFYISLMWCSAQSFGLVTQWYLKSIWLVPGSIPVLYV